jgi:hypothetical protein
VVSGDAGVGKTALIEAGASYAVSAGIRVLRATGAQFEANVSFAGLHQVLFPRARPAITRCCSGSASSCGRWSPPAAAITPPAVHVPSALWLTRRSGRDGRGRRRLPGPVRAGTAGPGRRPEALRPGPHPWQGVYDALKADGYNVAVVQNPTLSLAGDVAATRR